MCHYYTNQRKNIEHLTRDTSSLITMHLYRYGKSELFLSELVKYFVVGVLRTEELPVCGKGLR